MFTAIDIGTWITWGEGPATSDNSRQIARMTPLRYVLSNGFKVRKSDLWLLGATRFGTCKVTSTNEIQDNELSLARQRAR